MQSELTFTVSINHTENLRVDSAQFTSDLATLLGAVLLPNFSLATRRLDDRRVVAGGECNGVEVFLRSAFITSDPLQG